MPESHDNRLSTRLRRLPGQLLLALINGTAILVIIAAILAVVASSKIMHLANNIALTMTDAVLSRVNVEPQQVLTNLQSVATDVHTLVAALEHEKADGGARLDPEIVRLSDRLSLLETDIKLLRDARSLLIDEAISQVGRSLSEVLQNFRACTDGGNKLPTLTQPSPQQADQP